MRRILIDLARRKRAVRHGGGQERVNFEDVDVATEKDDDQLLAMNDALDKLAVQHKVEGSAKHYWIHARTWLYQQITSERAK